MRRADRLMQLIQLLRDGDLHKAEDLAQATNVSLRTIYRDMETLAASGVPIEGERGIGYKVTAAITLPPLNLTITEVEALHIGLQAVTESADKELAAAAAALTSKIDAVMPEDRARAPSGAIRTRQKVAVTHATKDRIIRPLQLDYWGRLWTCVVWCETKRSFDELRVDQITALRLLPGLFVDEKGKSLADFNAQRASSSSV